MVEEAMTTIGVFLTGVAALSIASASTAARADELPDEMLGHWCATRIDTYVRDTCGPEVGMIYLGLDGFGNGDEYGCEFKSVMRLWDGSYFVRAACSDGGRTRNEEMVIQVADGELEIVTVSRTRDVF